MTLKQQIVSDIENVFFDVNDFAIAATYNSYDGNIVSANITVIINENMNVGDTDFGGASMSMITLKQSDVAEPLVYDKLVTSNGDEYTVRSRVNKSQGFITVMADRLQRQQGVR